MTEAMKTKFLQAHALVKRGKSVNEAVKEVGGISIYTYYTYRQKFARPRSTRTPKHRVVEIPQGSSGMVVAFYGPAEQVSAVVRGLQ